MKPNHFFILAAACLLAFTACQQTSETKPDMAQAKSEIQAIENAWADALNARDIDALMAMYTDDAVSMPYGAPLLSGKAAIRQHQERAVSEQGFVPVLGTGAADEDRRGERAVAGGQGQGPGQGHVGRAPGPRRVGTLHDEVEGARLERFAEALPPLQDAVASGDDEPSGRPEANGPGGGDAWPWPTSHRCIRLDACRTQRDAIE